MTNPKRPWTPWKDVVELREDVRTGELSLADFAADLYEVKMKKGRKVYVEPAEFFALTYPTTNLLDLAKDVILRLAGKNAKAIRQLELTYGGGKTHTLIALHHLVNDPEHLPDLPSVREFRARIGIVPPRARVAVLPFDKLDVEKGMEVVDPKGATRWLKHPWSVLAWQIAGAEGLALLHAENRDDERESPPAENLLEALLRLPQRDDLSTLVLIDEVLMYAHVKVTLDRAWLAHLVHFFQYLCQAVTKVDRAALVASLLATDTGRSDALGKQIVKELSEILARQKEEGVAPVQKEDVAEVLRRRFFTPKSIGTPALFREHVIAAIQGICDLDEGVRKDRKAAEERFLRSYPFHPDLTDVFYTKWTQIDGFQKTRGVLRTFALALRDAEPWDESPLVGPSVFLPSPGKSGVCEAARELTGIASRAPTEGSSPNWSAILEGELEKARAVQGEYPSLRGREIEQAVVATFLHSQPGDQHANLGELIVMIGATRPDRITLEKCLRLWFDRSWFLDESADAAPRVAGDGPRPLPLKWRLGSKPNLRQMHHDALPRVSGGLVEGRLVEEVRKLKSLTTGASPAGARVHVLPSKPAEIEDDGEFRYAVLGPDAASESGKPSAEARRFLEENTGPDNPRKERNAVVLAVPSRDGVEVVRSAIRDALAWDEVRESLKAQAPDATRVGILEGHRQQAVRKVPESLAQAYCIVVTVSEKGDVQAFKIQVGEKPLFQSIKEDSRARVQDAPISADAILPGGPYALWRDGEESRRVKDIVGAFARFPHLPKMLNRRAITDTIVNGCRDGAFVGRVTRADRSVRCFWRAAPDESVLDDPSFEVVLPEKATLTELSSSLLHPKIIRELWGAGNPTVADVRGLFSGGRTLAVDRGGYEENLTVPRVPAAVVDAAISAAVKEGRIWLTVGPASFLAEDLPSGMCTDIALLQPPPTPISPTELLPAILPGAWAGGATTGLSLLTALSQRAGTNLPWATVRDAIDAGVRSRVIERSPDSGPWPCDFTGAGTVRLRLPTGGGAPPPPPPPPPSNVRVAEADLKPAEIQDLADAMGDLLKAAAGCEVKFRLRVELRAQGAPPPSTITSTNSVLQGVSVDLDLR